MGILAEHPGCCNPSQDLIYLAHVNKRLPQPSISTDGTAEEDDQELTARAQAGDPAAFRALFDKYHRRVFAVALGVVRDSDDALDVVQEAFIKAHKNLSSFRGNASFYTWLYRIVMNLCIDHTRRTKRARKVDFEEATAHLDSESDEITESSLSPKMLGQDPSRALLSKEIRDQVDRALSELSENHRTVLVMREVDGLSYEEMAEVMNCSKGTIMSRLFHARKNMQKLLRELEGRKD